MKSVARLAASLACAGAIVLLVFAGTLAFLGESGPRAIAALFSIVSMATFPAVAVLILINRPDNVIGRLFAWGGLAGAATLFSDKVVEYTFIERAGQVPGKDVWLWTAGWIEFVFAGTAVVFLILLYPNGRLAARSWRRFGWLAGVTTTCAALGAAFAPGPLEDFPSLSNPYGIEGSPWGPIWDALGALGWPLMLLMVIGAGASCVARFRRATGSERDQIKWMLFAGVLVLAAVNLWGLLGPLGYQAYPAIATGLITGGLAGATGIGVLRHRLLDVDVVINKTLVYVVLTATLAGGYLLSILLLQRVLPLHPESDLAVAASTLLVAALFRPARRRIQEFIDRRFYRSRYDATRTVEHFAATLRNEIDLTAVKSELVDTVGRTLQPRLIWLWMPAQQSTRENA